MISFVVNDCNFSNRSYNVTIIIIDIMTYPPNSGQLLIILRYYLASSYSIIYTSGDSVDIYTQKTQKVVILLFSNHGKFTVYKSSYNICWTFLPRHFKDLMSKCIEFYKTIVNFRVIFSFKVVSWLFDFN